MVKPLYLFDLPDKLSSSLVPFRFQQDSESDSSASESESEADTDEELEPPPLAKIAEEQDEETTWKLQRLAHIAGHPYVYFTSPVLDNDQVLTVYKRWLDKDKLLDKPVEAVHELDASGKSAVILVGGGHFSAAIIEHKPKSNRPDRNNPFANIVTVVSKSFHRYTTRRKQGGAQSASDNAHGKANSAGSTIRRQNEMELEREIHELLDQWAAELDGCQRIFYRSAGRTNRKLLMGYSTKAPIQPTDPRLRSIPITTRRPTAEEVKRVWTELTKVRIIPKPDLPTVPKETTKTPTPAPVSKPATPEPLPVLREEEKLSKSIIEAINKSQLTTLRELLTSSNEGYDFMLQPKPKYKANPTALVYAVRNGKHQVVANLLRWGADPTIRGGNQVIGDIAKQNNKIAETLQIARKELGESRWNWDACRVGPPMTADEIQEKKRVDQRQKLEQKKKRIEMEEKQAKEQRLEKLIAKHGSGRKVGDSQTGMTGLSDEEKRHIERERRARAAEARLARLQNH